MSKKPKKRKKGGGSNGRRPLRPAEITAFHKGRKVKRTTEGDRMIHSAREFLRRGGRLDGDPLVTFIVPTIGRPSLAAALRSVHMQSNGRWRCVVVGDGIEPDLVEGADYRDADRFIYVRAARSNSAGITRNVGLAFVNTPWVAFLDDDDTLSPDYVQALEVESTNGRGEEAGCIVFPMLHPDLGVLPPPELTDAIDLRWGQVGISFAVRQEWLDEPHTIRFIRERPLDPEGGKNNEDVSFLLKLRDECGAVVHIAKTEALYFVGPDAD